jgi:hypothetical protein
MRLTEILGMRARNQIDLYHPSGLKGNHSMQQQSQPASSSEKRSVEFRSVGGVSREDGIRDPRLGPMVPSRS